MPSSRSDGQNVTKKMANRRNSYSQLVHKKPKRGQTSINTTTLDHRSRFKDSKDGLASRTIQKLGIEAEPAMLAEIDNPYLDTPRHRRPFFQLLGLIGGDKSLNILREKVAELVESKVDAKRPRSNTLHYNLNKAIKAIEKRQASKSSDQTKS